MNSFLTTMIYLHCRRPHLNSAPSPLDWLPIRQCPRWVDPSQQKALPAQPPKIDPEDQSPRSLVLVKTCGISPRPACMVGCNVCFPRNERSSFQTCATMGRAHGGRLQIQTSLPSFAAAIGFVSISRGHVEFARVGLRQVKNQ